MAGGDVADDPFFHLGKVNDAIERLAASDRITIFAGAGVAKDRNSPDWRELVETLLGLTLQKSRIRDVRRHQSSLTEVFSKRSTPLMTASAIRYLEEQRSNPAQVANAIADVLYADQGPTGHLAQGIAWLATLLKMLGHDVAVITTNYDLYIEDALEDVPDLHPELASIKLTPQVERTRDVGALEVPVYHFHGVIQPDGGRLGDVTFCEINYSEIRGGWQEALLVERLISGSVLFVGASMTDPYIAYCLFEALKQLPPTDDAGSDSAQKELAKRRLEESPWVAVIPLQGEPWWKDVLASRRSRTGESIPRSAALKVAEARLGYLGVEALFADYYSQVGQFCWEVFNCVVQGPGSYSDTHSGHRYGHRLVKWWDRWQATIRDEQGISEDSQSLMQDTLLQTKQRIVNRLTDRAEGEQFKVELWVRSNPEPTSRDLILWATSQAELRDESTLHEARITHDSEYVAVRTFAEGRCIGPPTDEEAELLARGRRWQSYISVPIWLDDEPWGHLPVGTVALMATAPRDRGQSVLASIQTEDRNWIADELRAAGISLLTPA